MATSLLDDLLERVFRAQFRQDGPDPSALFEGNGALSTFSGKIDTAYFLELISNRQRSGLHTLRRTRNKHAHLFNPVSFDSDQMKSFCSGEVRDGISEARDEPLWVALGIDETPRSRFVDRVMSHCSVLFATIDLVAKRALDQDRFQQHQIAQLQDETKRLERLADEADPCSPADGS